MLPSVKWRRPVFSVVFLAATSRWWFVQLRRGVSFRLLFFVVCPSVSRRRCCRASVPVGQGRQAAVADAGHTKLG